MYKLIKFNPFKFNCDKFIQLNNKIKTFSILCLPSSEILIASLSTTSCLMSRPFSLATGDIAGLSLAVVFVGVAPAVVVVVGEALGVTVEDDDV